MYTVVHQKHQLVFAWGTSRFRQIASNQKEMKGPPCIRHSHTVQSGLRKLFVQPAIGRKDLLIRSAVSFGAIGPLAQGDERDTNQKLKQGGSVHELFKEFH
jgi:hypothetical protein